MDTREFFTRLWRDYIAIAPQAQAIQQLLAEDDTGLVNDHVAFRTFSETAIDLRALTDVVLSLGYEVQKHYAFDNKGLRATSFIHPDVTVPKIFLSELERHRLSADSQGILSRYCQHIAEPLLYPAIFWSGRHWEMPTLTDYRALLAESEYAAWLLVIGLRANHFTISVNHLNGSPDLETVLQRVEQGGFAINSCGGRIKGGPVDMLEQGATLADRLEFTFAGGERVLVPTCFYEFALRYPDSCGKLYQGFVAANANNIFESTSTAATRSRLPPMA